MLKKIRSTILALAAICSANALAVDSVKVETDQVAVPIALINSETSPLDSTQVCFLDTFKIKTVVLADRFTTNLDHIKIEPSMLFMPLIFEQYEDFPDTIAAAPKAPLYQFDAGDQWLTDAIAYNSCVRRLRFKTMLNNPELNHYNLDILPEPPKQYEIVADPSDRKLELEKKPLDQKLELATDDAETPVKVRNWLHTFNGSIHFSQAYLSDNWYQGGNNNLNILANFVWDINLNQNKYKNLMFDNTIQYKIGLQSAPQDSLRGYSISEDLLQINSKFGYKAFKHWYYSTTLLFKTQLLNNYAANSNDLKASFLTPGELNLGLGMTYNAKSKNGYANFDLSLSPLSYNLKICRENTRVNPTSMGVDEGKKTKHKFGSSVEARFQWKITPQISWNSRLYAFTDYDKVQGDWEHTFNFSINKYLSTQFYMHLRYDNGAAKHEDWKYWQFKEILSFGLTYRFSMQ